MLEAMRRSLPDTGQGILKQLRENTAGSTLYITALYTFLIMSLIGGGVDIARGYKAERRLQAACDAGVLAARKAVPGGDFTTAVEAEVMGQAQEYFDANF